MPISYTIPTEYQFFYRYGAADSVATASTSVDLTALNINPTSLQGFQRKHDEALVPEGDGALDLSDGRVGPASIQFRGEMYGDDPDDTFTAIASRMNQLAVSTPQAYLVASLYDGSIKQSYRRYGKFIGAEPNYVRKTRYSALSFDGEFRVLDPWWYYNTAETDTVTVTSGTSSSKVTTDTGTARSKRLVITITRTGATPTNVTVSNNAGSSFQVTGTLATNGDKWTIDCYAGTVSKTVSGVTTDDIANFSGVFWGIKNGTDTISTTSSATASYTVGLSWLERRM